MTATERARRLWNSPERLSFILMAVLFGLMIWLHLASLLLAALFSYLLLRQIPVQSRIGRWLAVVLFVVTLTALGSTLTLFLRHAFAALPEIADKAIPSISEWARPYRIEMPFADYDSLRSVTLENIRGQLKYLGSFAKYAGFAANVALFLVAGCVVAIGFFLNPNFELGRDASVSPRNLYTTTCEQLAQRFRLFYQSFATVIGAQIIISAINTILTAIFIFAVDMPYATLIIGVTFLCGLLPVVGNLMSNTVIVGIGFTVSPKMALTALAYLVIIHKLEYFLNSKIIGHRIRNPLWLTLIGLIVGERLMGIPGMILAPVLLNYIKRELYRVETSAPPAAAAPTTPDPLTVRVAETADLAP